MELSADNRYKIPQNRFEVSTNLSLGTWAPDYPIATDKIHSNLFTFNCSEKDYY